MSSFVYYFMIRGQRVKKVLRALAPVGVAVGVGFLANKQQANIRFREKQRSEIVSELKKQKLSLTSTQLALKLGLNPKIPNDSLTIRLIEGISKKTRVEQTSVINVIRTNIGYLNGTTFEIPKNVSPSEKK